MRFAIILQHAPSYNVQIAHNYMQQSRLHSFRVRKSCYRPIQRLRHQSLIVHSRSKLVHVYSLMYDDITACEFGDLVLGECGTRNKSHEKRVPVRIGNATPPAAG